MDSRIQIQHWSKETRINIGETFRAVSTKVGTPYKVMRFIPHHFFYVLVK